MRPLYRLTRTGDGGVGFLFDRRRKRSTRRCAIFLGNRRALLHYEFIKRCVGVPQIWVSRHESRMHAPKLKWGGAAYAELSTVFHRWDPPIRNDVEAVLHISKQLLEKRLRICRRADSLHVHQRGISRQFVSRAFEPFVGENFRRFKVRACKCITGVVYSQILLHPLYNSSAWREKCRFRLSWRRP
jgi:hypothetical protein